ncbi:hypothetical protein PFISCL1PPCAC_22802, partial [Pristionchus fissidentatus]
LDRRRTCGYRARRVHVGPSTVSKLIIPEDTVDALTWYHANDEDKEATNSALNRPDPLGIDGYNVEYSLNKKGRWSIPARFESEIEELQDPHHNVRVSASTHQVDVSDEKGFSKLEKDNRNRPALSYHTVSRDGKKVVNNYAKKGQARLQTLINPAGLKPWDPSKDVYKRKKQKEYFEESVFEKACLPLDASEDQKLHVQYLTKELVLKPSTYSKKVKDPQNKKTLTKGRKKNDPWLLEPLEESEKEEEEDEDPISSDTQDAPVAPSLGSFIVRPPGKHLNRHHRRSKRESFKDESFRSSAMSMISEEITFESSEEEYSESEASEDIVIVESPSRIVLVTALPQIYSRVRLVDTQLESLAALPVQPRAWQVHSQDTKAVLGRAFPICLVAKEVGDGDIGLFAQENCLSCADRWGRFRILLEDAGTVPEAASNAPASCGVCCRALVQDALFEVDRPFALACGHSFCTECWLRSISDGMKKGRVPTACLEPSCSQSLSLTAASALLDSVSLLRYTDHLTEALLKLQQIVRCRDCSRLHRVVSSRPSVRCECGTSICARCSSVAHAPVSCKAFGGYCRYMQANGMCSAHVSAADAPIVRNLSQCPKCGQMGDVEPVFFDWCRQVFCTCGQRYCHKCSKKWTDEHWSCDVPDGMKSVTMIDVSSSKEADLQSEMLSLSIGARLAYFERRKEVADRLQQLSLKTRKEFDQIFLKLSHLMEICYLNSTKSKRSLVLAERIQFAMNYFFNTTDKNRANLIRKTERLRKILNDITDELFGPNSRVKIVNKKSE